VLAVEAAYRRYGMPRLCLTCALLSHHYHLPAVRQCSVLASTDHHWVGLSAMQRQSSPRQRQSTGPPQGSVCCLVTSLFRSATLCEPVTACGVPHSQTRGAQQHLLADVSGSHSKNREGLDELSLGEGPAGGSSTRGAPGRCPCVGPMAGQAGLPERPEARGRQCLPAWLIHLAAARSMHQ
jgi:hypothetical protein